MKAAALLHPDVHDSAVLPFREICPELSVSGELSGDSRAALVFGGDGTIHRLLPVLYRHRIPALVVPAGSGNDFARALGIRNVRSAIKAWKHFCHAGDNVRAIDLGIIRSKENEILFCCVAGAGLDAQSNALANRMPAWVRGHGGYILAALWCLATARAQEIRITAPETQTAGQAWFVAVGNADRYGGGLKIAPHAALDDGLLDVCRVSKMNKLKLLCVLPTVFAGAHLGLREVQYFKAAMVRVEAEPEIEIYADGEPAGRTPAEFCVLPRALNVIIPV